MRPSLAPVLALARERAPLLSQLADFYSEIAKQLFSFTRDLEIGGDRPDIAFILQRRAHLDGHSSGQMVVTGASVFQIRRLFRRQIGHFFRRRAESRQRLDGMRDFSAGEAVITMAAPRLYR